jgi:hypothetical protein
MNTATAQINDGTKVDRCDFEECDSCKCPNHGGTLRKIYRYGSTMSMETDLFTFYGCSCSVSISHDPVGTYPSVATYWDHFNGGIGKLNAMCAKAKYNF